MSKNAGSFDRFAYGLEITGKIPAIDHHSHAGYIRPGERPATFDAQETEAGAGYVEARVPARVFQNYVRAKRRQDKQTVEWFEKQYGIPQLFEESKEVFQTTTYGRSLQLGAELLYGTPDREKQLEMARGRIDDFRGLYDDALDVSGTRMVLTDVPELDAEAWTPDRYRQIARIDPYMYPFGHDPYEGRGYDTPRFEFILHEKLVDELEKQGLDEVPRTLDSYCDFVTDSIKQRVAAGVVGLKIVSAYVRPLDFKQVSQEVAAEAYQAMRKADPAEPHPAERRILSDYLAGYIAELAVEMDLPLQIHTGIGHSEPGLRIANANPLLLEEFLNTPRLNRLKVILIHGGHPYSSYLGAMAHSLGNVHLDFSWMPYLHEHHMERVLQEWLEYLPAHKVMYGTDTACAELHAAATMRARESLEKVLQSGLKSGFWTPQMTDDLARRVLAGNAATLYGLDED